MAYSKVELNRNDNEALYVPIGFSWITFLSLLFFVSLVFVVSHGDLTWLDSDFHIKRFVFFLFVVIVVSMNVNGICFRRHISKGFKVSSIRNLMGEKEDVLGLNPIEYSSDLNKFYIWVVRAEVKYMKYFDSAKNAVNFLGRWPEKCLSVRHIVKTVRFLEKNGIYTIGKYDLPIEKWAAEYQVFFGPGEPPSADIVSALPFRELRVFLKRRARMNKVAEDVTGAGAMLKSVSGLIVFGFLIYSLYFTGYYELTILKGVLAFIALSIFIGFTSMIPFGATFSPILFEWWWHDIPFWDFTTAAWVVTSISMAANVLLVAGFGLAQGRE